MAEPTIVLLVVMGLTTADRPRGSVVGSAVAGGLGANARVLVEERAARPTDAEATSAADRLGGTAVAEIAWSDATHSRALLHVYLASDHSWYDQELSFDAPDAPEDRERSIGLLVGAMIRARHVDDPAVPGPAPAPAPLAPPAAAVAMTPPPTAAEQPDPAVVGARRRRFGVDIGGFGMAGVGGEAPGFGPAMRARWLLNRTVSLHGGGAVGFGSLPDAGAHMNTTRIGVGGRWRFFSFQDDALALDVGLEAIAVHHVIHRTVPEASRDRWLSGGHIDGGGVAALGRSFELYATLGADVVFGATPITVAGARVAQLPPARVTAEAGARILF